MQEESGLVEAETLMRYIRVLSELSNQVRYATQKRVLIEIALIKLCKPAMETNYDSILDRIRVIERQLEQGVVVNTSSQIAQSDSVPQQKVEPAKEETLEALQKAIPEELQEVAKNWERLLGMVPATLRAYLRDATPTVGEGNSLLLVFEDGVTYGLLKKDEPLKEIKDAIERMLGKEVQVRASLQQSGTAGKDMMLDLSKFSKMTIEYED